MKKKYIYIGIGLMITLMVGYLVIWESMSGHTHRTFGRKMWFIRVPMVISWRRRVIFCTTSRSRAFLVLLEIWWGRPGMTRLVCLSGRLFLVTALMSEAYFENGRWYRGLSSICDSDHGIRSAKSTGLDEVQGSASKRITPREKGGGAANLFCYVSAICYFRIDGWHAIVSEELLDMSLQGHKT